MALFTYRESRRQMMIFDKPRAYWIPTPYHQVHTREKALFHHAGRFFLTFFVNSVADSLDSTSLR